MCDVYVSLANYMYFSFGFSFVCALMAYKYSVVHCLYYSFLLLLLLLSDAWNYGESPSARHP